MRNGSGSTKRTKRELASALLDAETHLGQERDAVAGRHHLDDGRQARGAEGVDRVDLLERAIRQRLIAQAVPLLEEKQALVLDQLLGGADAARELLALRHGENEAVLEERHVLEIGMLHGKREEQDIELAFEQLAGERLRLRLAHVQLELGIGLAEKRQQRRKHVGRDRGDDAQAQGARQHAARVMGKGNEVADVAQDARGARGDLEALVGELDTGAGALDEHETEALLELVYLHRERRLRHRAGIGRTAKVQLAGERIEVSQLLEGHVRHQDL